MPFPDLVEQAYLRGCRCRRPASTRRRRSTGTAKRGRAAVLLFLLRGGVLGSAGRHHDRRNEGDARRHRPRRRPLAQSGGGHRTDRGRLRAGHGLAHDRGTGVPHGRAAAQPRALDLQDPLRVGCAGAFQDRAVGRRQPRGHDLSLQGGRRAAADAGDLGVRRDRRRDPQPQSGARVPLDAPATPEVDPARRAGGEAQRCRSGRPSSVSSPTQGGPRW